MVFIERSQTVNMEKNYFTVLLYIWEKYQQVSELLDSCIGQSYYDLSTLAVSTGHSLIMSKI